MSSRYNKHTIRIPENKNTSCIHSFTKTFVPYYKLVFLSAAERQTHLRDASSIEKPQTIIITRRDL